LSKVGSSALRKALYFPAIVAKTHNIVIKRFCSNLLLKGKHPMTIVCAAMRKLLHVLFGVLKNKAPFNVNIG
jgi:transposase